MPPALAMAASSAISGIVGSQTGGGTTGAGGAQQQGFGQGGGMGGSSLLAGGLASALNPSQAQTSPGAYSPPSNIGEGYNYIPTGQANIDQLIQGILGNSGNLATGAGSSLVPSMHDIASAGSPQSQASADLLSSGGQAVGAGNSILQQVMQSIGPFLQQAFDPQSALYNRTLNQVQNQANVQNAQSGVGASPYGAGVANQAVSNFNIDWQNSQLGRMLQGITGLSSLGGTATQGAGLANQGIGEENMSGDILNLDYDQLAQAALGLSSQAAQPLQGYLQGAQPANALSNTVGLAQAQLVGNQNANAAAGVQQGLNQILPWVGQGLSGLYNSIFPSSNGASDTNPATGNSWATDAAPGPNQIEPM